ncbi:MAG: PH domain-containing protein [Aeromicrobium erythreum]
MTSDPFRPDDVDWRGVSPALATALRIWIGVPLLVALLVVGVAAALVPGPTWLRLLLAALAVVLVLGLGWVVWWPPRYQRSIAYAEQEDDLLVTRGVMFKRLVAIPYGRMQFVDVAADPVDRALSIASVTLHTASTETAATIPGLPADEARRLRNRLTELGEARGAGV